MSINDRQLEQLLKNLPAEQAPDRDLWLDIEPQLAERSSARRGSGLPAWAIAASVLLCVSLIWWQSSPQPADPAVEPQQHAELIRNGDFPRQWAQQQHVYASEIRALSRRISELEDRQALALPDGIKQGLSGILAAEHSISKAIIKRPQSALLSRKLAEVQEIHVNLLRRVVAEAV